MYYFQLVAGYHRILKREKTFARDKEYYFPYFRCIKGVEFGSVTINAVSTVTFCTIMEEFLFQHKDLPISSHGTSIRVSQSPILDK